MAVRRYALVYQAGIANIFRVSCFNLSDYGRDAMRVYQGDFHTAEAIFHGMWLGGAKLMTAHCPNAGDIAHQQWRTDFDAMPFRESARPPIAYAAH